MPSSMSVPESAHNHSGCCEIPAVDMGANLDSPLYVYRGGLVGLVDLVGDRSRGV